MENVEYSDAKRSTAHRFGNQIHHHKLQFKSIPSITTETHTTDTIVFTTPTSTITQMYFSVRSSDSQGGSTGSYSDYLLEKAPLRRQDEARSAKQAYRRRERIAMEKYKSFAKLEMRKSRLTTGANMGLHRFYPTTTSAHEVPVQQWPPWVRIAKSTPLGPPSVDSIKTYTREAFKRVKPLLSRQLMARQPLWSIRSSTHNSTHPDHPDPPCLKSTTKSPCPSPPSSWDGMYQIIRKVGGVGGGCIYFVLGATHHVVRWYVTENESDQELQPGIEEWCKTLALQPKLDVDDSRWPVRITPHPTLTALDQVEAVFADQVSPSTYTQIQTQKLLPLTQTLKLPHSYPGPC